MSGNNYQARGGGGGGSSNYRGGGGGGNNYQGRGGGRGRGPGGRGGHHHGGGRGPDVLPAKFRPCKSWLTSGTCPQGPQCKFSHVVQLHATVEASNFVQPSNKQNSFNNNYNQSPPPQQRASVSSIALWQQTDGSLKIFSGSQDGFWRLWNTSNNFAREVEYNVGTKVDCLHVVNHFLFCGMQANCARGFSMPTPVGMLHAWNLQSAHSPPLELHVDPPFLAYAHNQAVTAVTVMDTIVVTGSLDGSLRVWKFNNNAFVLDQSLPGHARQVTGLVLVDAASAAAAAAGQPPPATKSPPNLLWSSSTDGSIRIWDLATGKCQYSISNEQGSQAGAAGSNPQQQPPQPPAADGQGHSHAVTALDSFSSPQGHFCLSASLDMTIKAWKATTGECVATESHGEGVISLCLCTEPSPRQCQVVLVGLESGNIVCRNLIPQGHTAAFAVLFVLTQKFNTSHVGAVQCLKAGPQSTFYSGGNDGKMMVWQINGDLGLQ